MSEHKPVKATPTIEWFCPNCNCINHGLDTLEPDKIKAIKSDNIFCAHCLEDISVFTEISN